MPESASPTFGVLLRAYRRRRVWSQQELAQRCGLSVRTVGNLERGVVSPRGDSVHMLAAALGLSADEEAELERAAGATGPGVVGAVAAERLPRQLPADLLDFTGRETEVAAVAEWLTGAPSAVPVVVLGGQPGVGKSALAVHVAHRVADHFPDGQLYVNLRGARSGPLRPATVLDRFLRALGVEPSAVPRDDEEREATYRSVLAGRRMLVVLDDAGDEAQVRPLVPGSPGSAVLVTSRTRLTGLAGARSVEVAVLAPGPAVELLARVAGPERVAADTATAAAIVERCGRLPLAVRIAGARLATRPGWSLTRLLDFLDDEWGRLDQLAIGDLRVRASLALSYAALTEESRRAFRLLGSADVADFSSWLLAALVPVPVPAAERLLDRLVDAHLLDASTVGGIERYRIHDLVRVYARERAAEDPAARRAALERLTGCWLALAEEADKRIPTTSNIVTIGDATRWWPAGIRVDEVLADPLGWLDLEGDNLLAAVRAAAAADLAEHAWELVGRLGAWLALRNDSGGNDAVISAALAACRRGGDLRGEAALLVNGAQAPASLAMTPDRRDRLRRALTIFRELEDHHGQAAALIAFGVGSGPEDMDRYGRQALELARRAGGIDTELFALTLIGRAAEQRGRPTEAAAAFGEALGIARRLGYIENEADLLWRLGRLGLVAGRVADADDLLDRALSMIRRLGNRRGEATVLVSLAETRLAGGRPHEAEQLLKDASALWTFTDEGFAAARLKELRDRLRTARTAGRPAGPD